MINYRIILCFTLLMASCDKPQRMVWEQNSAIVPYSDTYIEFHFKTMNEGLIKTIGGFDDYSFNLDSGNAYFLNDTFNITYLNSKRIALRNEHYYAEFNEKHYENSDDHSIDSLFQLHRILYSIRDLDLNKKSIFAEDYYIDLIDLLNGVYFDREKLKLK